MTYFDTSTVTQMWAKKTYNNNNNNDVLYNADIRLKEGAHGAFAENIIDKYS